MKIADQIKRWKRIETALRTIRDWARDCEYVDQGDIVELADDALDIEDQPEKEW